VRIPAAITAVVSRPCSKLKMRTLGFLILFAVVFSCTTLSHHGGALGLGQSTFTAYGWPQPWLHVHNRDTRNSVWVNGQVRPGERTTTIESVQFPALVASAATSAAMAGILSLPFLFRMRDKNESTGHEAKDA
jgi:hypothetical protein